MECWNAGLTSLLAYLVGLECLECWNAGVCQNAVLWEAAGMNVASIRIEDQGEVQKKTNNKKYI